MFKATKVGKKIKKRNKPTYRSANKSLFVQNFRQLFLLFIAVSRAIVMLTR